MFQTCIDFLVCSCLTIHNITTSTKKSCEENNPYILQPWAHTGLHTSKAGSERLPKITEAVLHSPLRPSKAVRLPARLKMPQKSNWEFSPTQGATIHQTMIGTVAFCPTTFDSFSEVVCCDAAGQAKCFHVWPVIAFIQQMLQLVLSDDLKLNKK